VRSRGARFVDSATLAADSPRIRSIPPRSGFAQVLRAYDSRFRPTPRRPDVYGDRDIAPGAKVLCRVVDKHIAGKLPPRGEDWLAFQLWDRRPSRLYDPWKVRRWLWQFGGELLVIETDFHEGRHYALSPMDFGPVVQFLQTMHENGYVHGDVRCANVVFGKCLIDFDLGGRVEDAPTYPDGFQNTLVDGSRRGRSGQKITKSDDWYALLTVIFRVHMLPVPEGVATIDLYKRRERFLGLIGSSATDPDAVSLTDSTVQGLGSELIGFLKDVGPWKISFSDSFRDLVMQWGGPSGADESAPARSGVLQPRQGLTM
jgi:hypothetical protein